MSAHLEFDFNDKHYDLIAHSVWELKLAGGYITDSSRWTRIAERHGRIPKVVVDVGANAGLLSIAYSLAFPESRIIAIEPCPESCMAIAHNTAGLNVEIINKAVGNSPGMVTMSLPTIEQRGQEDRRSLELEKKLAENLGILSVYGTSGLYRIEAEVDTLDNLVGDLDVGWLKIDVEGHELAVLEGADSLLRNHKPIIVIELSFENQTMAGHTVEEVRKKIESYGYQLLKQKGLDAVFVPL